VESLPTMAKNAAEEAPLPAEPVPAPAPAAEAKQKKRSITSVRSRKSVAASVFLLPNLSVTNRLGRHLQVEKYDDYEQPLEAEDRKKKEQKRKKSEECKLFCCDRANKKCMGKNAFSWVMMILALFIFWSFLILLMFVFFEIFMAIEGKLPRSRNATNIPLEEKTPMLVNLETVKENVKKGWAKGTIVFPYQFGSQLFFPGTSPMTVDVYALSNSNSEQRKLAEKYKDDPVFTFETDKTGLPTTEFRERQLAAYQYFFDKNYKTPTADVNLDSNCNTFRQSDDPSASCPWPAQKNTTRDGFKPVFTRDKNDPKIYYPVLFFTVNTIIGWVPQITSSNKLGRIMCELDMHDVKNTAAKLRRTDFEGEIMDCAKTNISRDFCGIRLFRFPFYGQPDVKSPIIRYEIKKMPKTSERFVLQCRLDYDGFEKQKESLSYPFSFRGERMWTKITIKRIVSP